MSARVGKSHRALARWRSFEESVAEGRRLSANACATKAQELDAEARLEHRIVVQYRSDMLDSGTIDLGKLRVAEELEDAACHHRDACNAHLMESILAKGEAMAALSDAKARRRVVDRRNARVLALEKDQSEKRMFDFMSIARVRNEDWSSQ